VSHNPSNVEKSATERVREAGLWAKALDVLSEWDPHWTEKYASMALNPWTDGVLSGKELQLIAVGLSAAITNLDGAALRRNIRAALGGGATREEILEVLKMAAMLSIHSMSLGAPILLEELKAASKPASSSKPKPPTPACDQMRAMGQWNQAWDPFYDLDPAWTDQFFGPATLIYGKRLFSPKFVELISIAFDAAITHMYAPGTRRHIKAALALGASAEEIMTVLKLCVSQGVNALDFGVPILAEELAEFEGKGRTREGPAASPKRR
jgi:alkylhydroperoxidase/carboxymuconolactone decarboxylase family protein YurZ